VRLPQPDVHVAMAQPQVQVHQPQPQVQMAQPQGAPVVQVQRQQPQVEIQQPPQEPQIQVQQAQPIVRYERMGEPRIVYDQAPGQPVVRIEQIPQEPAAQAGATMPPGEQRQGMTEEERLRAQQRLMVEDPAEVEANLAQVQTTPVAIGDLDNREVFNARGERLGEVGQAVLDPRTNRQYLVVERGGFLGIGRDRVAFPIERFWMRGEQLVLRGVTVEDIEAMDHYRDQIQNFQQVADTDRVDLRLWN
jgi:sporulation protein YlmC with PRC-barrel domain